MIFHRRSAYGRSSSLESIPPASASAILLGIRRARTIYRRIGVVRFTMFPLWKSFYVAIGEF